MTLRRLYLSAAIFTLLACLAMANSSGGGKEQIVFGEPQFSGAGCSEHRFYTFQHSISYILPKFEARTTPNVSSVNQSCNLVLPVEIPLGYTIEARNTYSSGESFFPAEDEKSSGMFDCYFHFDEDSKKQELTKTFAPGDSGEFVAETFWKSQNLRFTPCNKSSVIFRAITTLYAEKGSPASEEVYLNMMGPDSSTGFEFVIVSCSESMVE